MLFPFNRELIIKKRAGMIWDAHKKKKWIPINNRKESNLMKFRYININSTNVMQEMAAAFGLLLLGRNKQFILLFFFFFVFFFCVFFLFFLFFFFFIIYMNECNVKQSRFVLCSLGQNGGPKQLTIYSRKKKARKIWQNL